jgi:hypothetical protein
MNIQILGLLRMKLEDMGSAMTEDKIMINLLNNPTIDYELQMVF